MSVNEEYVLVIKEGLYWLAKKIEVKYCKPEAEDDNPEYIVEMLYKIDDTLEHNGFEYKEDAWSYLVYLDDKKKGLIKDGNTSGD